MFPLRSTESWCESFPTASGGAPAPSGTTAYNMFVVYGQTILPQTLKAALNEEDISDLFSPVAGGYEIVSLPVEQGQNLLVLSIKGESDGRMMSDEDELTFMVQ